MAFLSVRLSGSRKSLTSSRNEQPRAACDLSLYDRPDIATDIGEKPSGHGSGRSLWALFSTSDDWKTLRKKLLMDNIKHDPIFVSCWVESAFERVRKAREGAVLRI